MAVQRHFLGWSAPIVAGVSEFLLADRPADGCYDLSDALIMVPTRQAGRVLREYLARQCHQHGQALLIKPPVMPHYLFTQPLSSLNIAGPAHIKAAWVATLSAIDPAEYPAFFAKATRDKFDKIKWALQMAEGIEQLRQRLVDGGWSLGLVVERHGSELQEPERWQDMAALEKLYLQELARHDHADICIEKIRAAEQFQLPSEFKRIVVACVPDPPSLAIIALQRLAEACPVDVLIHAPGELADAFDEWGRPMPEYWKHAKLALPDDKHLFLESDPEMQARRVTKILANLPENMGPSDIGLGVPDKEVTLFLEQNLQQLGLHVFDPTEIPLSSHPLGRLLLLAGTYLQSPSYAPLADLLRHPDFLQYLCKVARVSSRRLLTVLDQLQNESLPSDLEGLLEACQAGLVSDAKGLKALQVALETMRDLFGQFKTQSMEEAWRVFLQTVYGVKSNSVAGREFQAVAEEVENILREFNQMNSSGLVQEPDLWPAIFMARLRECSYQRDPDMAQVDALGWLELPWLDTAMLVISGMNDEAVPGHRRADAFLPDSLLKMLGLRDDQSLFSRDVFLLQGMLESRRADGDVFLIFGKRSLAGDPLRPSRLLFRCDDDNLVERVKKLFGDPDTTEHPVAEQQLFKLNPAQAQPYSQLLDKKVISVTALRDYLACPFRFYLKRVLGMESLSDDRVEPDALAFGNLIHEVVKIMGEDKALWSCSDDKRLGNQLVDLLHEAASRRYGKKPVPAIEVALSSARARLRALARQQVKLVQEGWEIEVVEKSLEMSRHGWTIQGRVDRVDRNREGVIRLIDYKTADEAKKPHKAHLAKHKAETPDYNLCIAGDDGSEQGNKKKSPGDQQWIDLQLPIYHLLWQEKSKEPIALAYFNLPKATGETELVAWDSFEGTMLESADQCLQGVLDAIAAKRFWPPADKVEYDKEWQKLFVSSIADAFEELLLP